MSNFQRLRKLINADAAYSTLFDNVDIAGKKFLQTLLMVVCIPDKSNLKTKNPFDAEVYKHRNIVERFFQRIKNFRCTRCLCYSFLIYQQYLTMPVKVPRRNIVMVDTGAKKGGALSALDLLSGRYWQN